MSACGVSSSNTTAQSTHCRAARTSARSASAFSGRDGPLLARTERSELTPTISASPSRARGLEVADVAGVHQVEDAVGEDDGSAAGAHARDERQGGVEAEAGSGLQAPGSRPS